MNSESAMANYILNDKWAFGMDFGRQEGRFVKIHDDSPEILKPFGIGLTVADNHLIPLGIRLYAASKSSDSENGGQETESTDAIGLKIGTNWKRLYLNYTVSWEKILLAQNVFRYQNFDYYYHLYDLKIRLLDNEHHRINLCAELGFSTEEKRAGSSAVAGIYYEGNIGNRALVTAGLVFTADFLERIRDDYVFAERREPQINLGLEIPVLGGDHEKVHLVARTGGQISYVRTSEQGGGEPSTESADYVADDDYIALGLGAEWKDFQLDMSLDDELVWQTALSYNF